MEVNNVRAVFPEPVNETNVNLLIWE